MDPRVLNSIIAAALTALIGLFPWVVRADRLTRLFAASNLSLALWNLGDSFVYFPHNHETVVLLFRLNYVSGVFVVWCYFRFMFAFSKIPFESVRRTWQGLLYTGLALIGLSLTSLLVQDIDRSSRPFKEIPGPLYPVFVAFLLWGLGYALYRFFAQYKLSQGRDRLQLRLMLVALFFVFFEAIVFFLSLYFRKMPPAYFYLQVVYGLIVAYSILAHRLMDVSLIIRKTLVYSLVTISLGLIYLGVIAGFAQIFGDLTGKLTVMSSAVAAGLIAFAFQPLRKRVQEVIDRRFFRQYVNREEKLYELSREVVTHTTPEAMAESLLRVINDTLHPKTAVFYLRSRQSSGFSRVGSTAMEKTLPEEMGEANPLATYFSDNSQPFVIDSAAETGESRSTRREPSKGRAA